MPAPTRKPAAEHRCALELLAASPAGCTEAILLAHGFTVADMVELVGAGLASATAVKLVGDVAADLGAVKPLLQRQKMPRARQPPERARLQRRSDRSQAASRRAGAGTAAGTRIPAASLQRRYWLAGVVRLELANLSGPKSV